MDDAVMADDAPSIFTRIIRREIPASIRHEDDVCIAFDDVDPKAPLHVLVVPKEPFASLRDMAANGEAAALGHLMVVADRVAKEAGYDDYRTVSNTGAGAGQTVFHLHIHVLAGRDLGWPPG